MLLVSLGATRYLDLNEINVDTIDWIVVLVDGHIDSADLSNVI